VNEKYQPAFHQMPESIKALLRAAVKDIHPREIILFGSRARGTHRENSDFDICFKDADSNPVDRAKFKLRAEEESITLHKVDLVFFEELGEDYLQNIKGEGKLLYGA